LTRKKKTWIRVSARDEEVNRCHDGKRGRIKKERGTRFPEGTEGEEDEKEDKKRTSDRRKYRQHGTAFGGQTITKAT